MGWGYDDSLLPQFVQFLRAAQWDLSPPPWIGWDTFHLSHQSNLVRKDPKHYRKFFPTVPDNLPYIWPVRDLYDKLAMGYTQGSESMLSGRTH